MNMKPMRLSPLEERPLVSVLMSNYNYARFLPEALESLLSQTYVNWELIVCDDGSTDQSREVLGRFQQEDHRVRAVFKENGGQASAWNAAYEQSVGAVICLLDPDDLFLPEKLSSVVGAFQGHPAAGLVYHRFQPTNAQAQPVGASFPYELESGWLADAAMERGGWGAATVTSVISVRREVADVVFPIPEEFRRGFGDAFVQGVSQFLAEVHALPDALTLYRIHDANDSASLEPGLDDVAAMVEARPHAFEHIRAFVARRWGEGVASRLDLHDIESYWDYLAALYVLKGKPREGVQGYSGQELLRHLPRRRRRQVWRGLFWLPAGLSKRAFQFWWRKTWWKPHTRRLRDVSGWKSRIGSDGLRTGTLGMADQAVISGVNFVVLIAAARALGPSNFGVFALLYTLLAFTASSQESLITSAHNVIGVTKSGVAYQRYTTSIAICQGIMALVFGALLAGAALVALRLDAAFGAMLLALAFATVASQTQEFPRKVLYTETRVGAALVNDIFTRALIVGLLVALFATGGLTGERLFVILGVSLAAGAVVGMWQIRQSLGAGFDRSALHEHWEFGGWLFAGRIVEHMPRYMTAGVMASALSVSAYGAYRAASQLVHAANVPLKALSNVLRPRLARDAQQGPSAMWQTMLPIMLLGGGAFAVFGAALYLLREPLLSAIYGTEYLEYSAVMLLLVLQPLLRLQKQVLSNALQAIRRTRPIFVGSALGSTAGSALGTVALLVFGLPAAGAIWLSVTGITVLWLGWSWRQHAEGLSRLKVEKEAIPEVVASR